VLPGIARHASYFAGQGAASTVLVHRNDCIVVISLTGMSKEEATAVAKAAGN
jgi:DNA-binding MurR/RpiR family transcriptional regulator